MGDRGGKRQEYSDRGAILLGWEILRELKSSYIIYLVSAAIFAGISLLPAQVLHFFTVQLSSLTDTSLHAFLLKLGAFGLSVASCLAIAAFGKVFVKEWLQLKLEIHLRQMMIDHLHALPPEAMDKAHRGDWLTRLSGDVRVTEEFLGTSIPDLAYSALLFLATAGLLIYYAGPIGLIPIFAALVLGFVNFGVQRALRPLLEEMRTLYSGLFQILIENLEGWKTVQSFGATNFERDRVIQKLLLFRAKGLRAARLIGTMLSSSDFITHFLLTSCLMVLAWAVATRRITYEEALFFPFYLSQFLFSVKALVMGSNSWSRYLTNAGRLHEFFVLERAVPLALPAHVEASHEKRFEMAIDRLGLGDALTRPIPGEFSLTLRQGALYGITGRSGCGKSTFLEFIAGLRSARFGGVRVSAVDLANESEVQTVFSIQSGTPFLLPTQFCAYVDQKPYVFEGTLRTNLTFGKVEFTDERLNECLEQAGLAKTFAARGGLEMVIQDRGQNISVGQLYRIAIARALLLRRPFLLLDEPFAALDSQSSQALVATLSELKKQLGILVVTHYVPEGLALDALFSFVEEPAPAMAALPPLHDKVSAFNSSPGNVPGASVSSANRPGLRIMRSLSTG